MGGLPGLFTCIDNQSPAQPLHWKYPREAQIFAEIPPNPSCGEMTLLSFTQKLSQQLSLAQERALPGLGDI